MPNWIQITEDNKPKVMGWIDKANPGVSIAFKKPNRRSLDQNDLMWPYLRAIAKSVKWDGQEFTDYQWKEIFMGSLWGGLSVPGIHGGVIFVGARHSSDLTKSEMAELLDSIIAFASEHGIDIN